MIYSIFNVPIATEKLTVKRHFLKKRVNSFLQADTLTMQADALTMRADALTMQANTLTMQADALTMQANTFK